MAYSPTPRYRDVFQSAPGGGFVEKVKGFLRKIIPAPDSVVNLVRDNRSLPRFEENERGKYYIDSTGRRHWKGGTSGRRKLEDETVVLKDVYVYHDVVTYWLTPEEIEARIETTKPVALKVEESDNTPCDPEAVPGGEVSYNVSHTSTTVQPPVARYEGAEAAFEVNEWKNSSDINLSISRTKQPVAVHEPGNRRFQFEQEER